MAVGKTPSQLAHDIEMKLSEYVRSPHVNVIVTKPASLFSQVKVIGQVKSPEAIAYHEGMTVLDAVLAVGGLTEYASGNRARIVRMVDGAEKDIPVRLGALVNSGDMSQNLALNPATCSSSPKAGSEAMTTSSIPFDELRGAWRFRWAAVLAAVAVATVGWLFVFPLPDRTPPRPRCRRYPHGAEAGAAGPGDGPGCHVQLNYVRQGLLASRSSKSSRSRSASCRPPASGP